MPLPRPARLFRQAHLVLRRPSPTRPLHASATSAARLVEADDAEEVDDKVVMVKRRLGSRRKTLNMDRLPGNIVESELNGISSRIGEIDIGPQAPKGSFGLPAPEVEEDEAGHREARKSPAALLGSKRLELALLPPELLRAISGAIDDVDTRTIRQQYLRLQDEIGKSPERRSRPRMMEPELAVAAAAAYLPGEYAAVRNIFEEMDRRLGRDWLEKAADIARATHLAEKRGEDGQAVDQAEGEEDDVRPRVFEASASLGPGLWAMLDSRGMLPSAEEEGFLTRGPVDYQLYHGPSHTKAMVSKLVNAVPEDSASLDLPRKFDRSLTSSTPALTMSTFFLSTLPESSRRKHIRSLLAFNSPYTIIVDHARQDGWESISKAREYILSLSTDEAPLHMVAPCPHDQTCPLKDGRDMCGFSQRHQAPLFLRKTKHSKRGQEDKRYVYLVIGRGSRPVSSAIGTELGEAGRMGGVAKDQARRDLAKTAGKSVLREIEGGENGEVSFEMIPLKEVEEEQRAADGGKEPIDFESIDEGEMISQLRDEAFSWPRLVAPPIKASGHIIMDVCSQNGSIERMTIPKSHSKQGYHDARKSYWGDIFPHAPKGRVVTRTRGIKRLRAVSDTDESEDPISIFKDLFGFTPEQEASERKHYEILKSMPGLKMTTGDDRPKPKPTTRQGRKDLKRIEEARIGKMYRHPRPEEFDRFPLDVSPSEWVPPRDERPRQVKEAQKPKTSETERREQRHSDMWNAEASIFDMIAQQHGETRAAGPKVPGQADSGARRSYGTFVGSRVGLRSTGSVIQRRRMSVRPAERVGRAKVTIAELNRMKAAGMPITVLTAYDFPTSLLGESAGVDMVLVGDSLSQVALGHETTTSITLDEMIHHCKAVTKGAKTPFVFADLPFGYFESAIAKGVESTIRLIKEGGVDGVKIEGGQEILPLVERLSSVGIAVIPHLGLQPQRATSTSGYLVQGRTANDAEGLLETALAMERAGATAILLEAIPHVLAGYITERLTVPTIGIGAGPQTSGQVLVITDVLGTYALDTPEGGPKAGQPKFVRQFGNVGRESKRAVEEYMRCVRERSFPEIGKETYGMKKEQWEAFVGRKGEGGGVREEREGKEE